MTLVYARNDLQGPRTHAFIIGCGRFPYLRAEAARRATVAGARAIAKFLIKNADNLVAPLASVECLLSDPDVEIGKDQLGIGAVPHDARDEEARKKDAVEAAVSAFATTAGAAWLKRCEPGDHLFFYMSSHGVADSAATAAGLFENVLENPHNKWAQSLNVNTLALLLPLTGAGACWVFLDACQEIVPSILGQYNGAGGILLINGNPADLANTKSRSVALAGSRFGQKGWAPIAAKPPFFTQALLSSFTACVEPQAGGGWAVTGKQLLFGLREVADASLGHSTLETEPLVPFAQPVRLLNVEKPLIPVVIRTKIRADILKARGIKVVCPANVPQPVTQENMDFFTFVPPDGVQYTVVADFDPPLSYAPQPFYGQPCAQIVELAP